MYMKLIVRVMHKYIVYFIPGELQSVYVNITLERKMHKYIVNITQMASKSL